MFIEVSRLRENDEQNKSRRAFDAIWEAVNYIIHMAPRSVT
jgi:hypothetical protein